MLDVYEKIIFVISNHEQIFKPPDLDGDILYIIYLTVCVCKNSVFDEYRIYLSSNLTGLRNYNFTSNRKYGRYL